MEEASPEAQNDDFSKKKLLQAANSFHKDGSFQDHFGMSHQDALARVTAIAVAQHPILESLLPSSSTTLTHEKKVEKNGTLSLASPKTPNSDCFSWRKYGQKQVKNSASCRSYYRCTYYNCSAKKKVQHLDITGKIIQVVYKGQHNHDPPKNLKGSSRKRDHRDAPLTTQVNKKLDDSLTHTEVDRIVVPLAHESCEECVIPFDQTPRVKNEASTLPRETEGCKSSTANEIDMANSMKDYYVVPFKKRRIKESGKASPESVYRTFKEPKVVVHAAGDAGSPSDGYRWRKYGQKMVKGNSNPRSYYRCSSSGCLVRKHVEKSSDNSTVFIVTYEGIHDHDKPLPKGIPKPVRSRVEGKPKQGEGSDKVLDSARTLLSIGVELKSC